MKSTVLSDKSVGRLAQVRKHLTERFSALTVPFLARLHVSPNSLSWTGFALTAVMAYLAAYGYLIASGLVLLFASLLDTLDGALARYSNKVTRYGAVLDSTLDRLGEGVSLLGVLIFLLKISINPVMPVALTVMALIGSYLVSYVRARAEGLGLPCEVGISTRPERVLILVLGLLTRQVIIALSVITLMSFFTAGERLFHVWRETKDDSHKS
ncbi:MAG: CDP-alcohol phosphatidyltransferase family protein [Chloroflexota bacterium]